MRLETFLFRDILNTDFRASCAMSEGLVISMNDMKFEDKADGGSCLFRKRLGMLREVEEDKT